MGRPGDILSQYLRPGDRLQGRYAIEKPIGYGAFGAIFSAVDLEFDERVAVKALPPTEPGGDKTALGRFRREMKIIGNLVHDNIIGLYDFGQTPEGVFYMVLEYVDGVTLEQAVAGGPLGREQALSVTAQMTEALGVAHEAGVIHRDLKPANIMLEQRRTGYHVKVLDFGMAKLLQSMGEDSLPQLTREGMAVGTPRYIAPEQARNQAVGPWTDLYAVGLLMYEMLTGERAVNANSVESAVAAHVSRQRLPLERLGRVDDDLKPILERLLEKDRHKRYQAANELLADLELAQRGQGAGIGSPVGTGIDPRSGQVRGGEVRRSDGAAAGERPQAGASAQASHRPADSAQRPAPPAPADEELDLDWDRYDDYAGPDTDPGAPARQAQGKWVFWRTPQTGAEWAEAVAAPLLALFGFIVLTSHLRQFGYPVRLGLGLVPTLLPLGMLLLSRSREWARSFFRLWLLCSLVAIALAHALGPQALINELFRNPTWFLDPLEAVPGVEALGDALDWLMRRYAMVLSELVG